METVNSFVNNSYIIARRAFRSYFSPFIHHESLLANSLSKEKKSQDCIDNEPETIKLINFIQKVICFNQGSFIQYAFIAAEKHKDLRKSFDKRTDPSLIKDKTKLLIDFLNKSFYSNTYKNFEHIHFHFNGRNICKPRICIKGSFFINNENTVVTVFRDSPVDYSSGALLENSSAFEYILNTGKYYLENNIPIKAAKGDYKSPRLDREKVSGYISGKIKNWHECWGEYSFDADKKNYYKSTLIVPMTLWNNDLSEEFKNLINIDDVDRVIFGFLCMDHIDENYFNEEIDVPVAYIFADIISLYIITRIIYTEISDTYDKVQSYLKKQGIDVVMGEIEEIVYDVLDSVGDLKDFISDLKETKNNKLISLDDSLLKYSRLNQT